MTLIVGRRFPASIRIVADSKVTDESVLRGSVFRGTYLTGALKAVIINRALCIGCAGTRAQAAVEAIRSLGVGEDFDVRDVERHFQHAAKAVDGANQFLVASINEPVTLSRVTARDIQREPDQQWIGDQAAFNGFQRYRLDEWWRLEAKDADGNPVELDLRSGAQERRQFWVNEGRGDEFDEHEAFDRMMGALEKVIDSDEFPAVEGIALRIDGAWPQGFQYRPMVKMIGGFRLPTEPEITQGVILRMSAAEGGFGYRVCTTRSGIGALGIYFVQGAVGVFFHPMQRDDGFIYRQVSQEQFEAAVYRQFGLELRC